MMIAGNSTISDNNDERKVAAVTEPGADTATSTTENGSRFCTTHYRELGKRGPTAAACAEATEKATPIRRGNRSVPAGGETSLRSRQKRKELRSTVGSIELDPLPDAEEVVLPVTTDCCAWSFEENSRVLLAKFNIKNNKSIDYRQKESLLKMMERDDITVVSEGLVDSLNQTLWHLDYVKSLVGDKPYHKVRRFERQLKSGNDNVNSKLHMPVKISIHVDASD